MKIVAVVLTSFIACVSAQDTNLKECIPDGTFNASVDYFPAKSSVEYSQRWGVTYHNSYKVLTVTESDTSDALTYVLYQCGSPKPDLGDVHYISVPVSNFSLTETPQIPHIELLGMRHEITAYASDPQYIESQCLKSLMNDGIVDTFTNTSMFMNDYPDSLSLVGVWSSNKADIGHIMIAESKEKSNMATFEWHKVYGLLFNEEATANRIFEETEEKYDCETANAIERSGEKEEKIVWAYWSHPSEWAPGGWDVAKCPNYYCEYAEHCGAEMLFSSEGSIPTAFGNFMNDTEFENFAMDADVMIYPSTGFIDIYNEKQAMLDNIKAVQNKHVYDYSSNAWFEKRMAMPDTVLADFCDVLGVGPEGYDRVWFRNVFSEGASSSETCNDPYAPLDTGVGSCERVFSASTLKSLGMKWKSSLMILGFILFV